MKKNIESEIPKSYWKTEVGQKIAGTMHSDGWEALDCFNNIINMLNEGIMNTTDEMILAKLKNARKKMYTAKKTYWDAITILHVGGF